MPDEISYKEDGPRQRPFEDVTESVVNRLESEAREHTCCRRLVEECWLTDTAQCEGRDEQDLIARLSEDRRSTAVVNITRRRGPDPARRFIASINPPTNSARNTPQSSSDLCRRPV